MEQNELQRIIENKIELINGNIGLTEDNKIELIEDSLSDINDTVIDIKKDIASIKEKLDCIATTLVIVASFGIGYILGSKYAS